MVPQIKLHKQFFWYRGTVATRFTSFLIENVTNTTWDIPRNTTSFSGQRSFSFKKYSVEGPLYKTQGVLKNRTCVWNYLRCNIIPETLHVIFVTFEVTKLSILFYTVHGHYTYRIQNWKFCDDRVTFGYKHKNIIRRLVEH